MTFKQFEGIIEKYGFFIKMIPTIEDSMSISRYYIVSPEMDMKARTAGISTSIFRSLTVFDEKRNRLYLGYGDEAQFNTDVERFTKNSLISWPLSIINGEVILTADIKAWLNYNNIIV